MKLNQFSGLMSAILQPSHGLVNLEGGGGAVNKKQFNEILAAIKKAKKQKK